MDDQTKPDAAEGQDAAAVAADAATAPATDTAAEVTAPAEGAQGDAATAPAVTEAATETPAPKPARAAKVKADAPDLDRLPGLIEQITNANTSGLRDLLIDDLRKNCGAKIKDADNTYSMTLAGISVSCTAGYGLLLANWCNKARRALLAAEA